MQHKSKWFCFIFTLWLYLFIGAGALTAQGWCPVLYNNAIDRCTRTHIVAMTVCNGDSQCEAAANEAYFNCTGQALCDYLQCMGDSCLASNERIALSLEFQPKLLIDQSLWLEASGASKVAW
jgi:hypothetical protein